MKSKSEKHQLFCDIDLRGNPLTIKQVIIITLSWDQLTKYLIIVKIGWDLL